MADLTADMLIKMGYKIEGEGKVMKMTETLRQLNTMLTKVGRKKKKLDDETAHLISTMIKETRVLRQAKSAAAARVRELDRQKKAREKLNKAMQGSKVQLHRLSGAMISLSLSTLFFGMAIQRLMGSIVKGTISTFNKIMEESGYFGSATQQLAVHWEYLKFVIGRALNDYLLPLIPAIVEVIGKITNWIQEHPKLTTKILLWSLAIGTALLALGTLGAAFSGIFTFVTKFSSVIGGAKGATAAVGGLSKVTSAFAWGPFLAGLAAVAVFAYLVYRGMQDGADVINNQYKQAIGDGTKSVNELNTELEKLNITLSVDGVEAWDLWSGAVTKAARLSIEATGGFLDMAKVIIGGVNSIKQLTMAKQAYLKGDISGGNKLLKSGIESSEVAARAGLKLQDMTGRIKDIINDPLSLVKQREAMNAREKAEFDGRTISGGLMPFGDTMIRELLAERAGITSPVVASGQTSLLADAIKTNNETNAKMLETDRQMLETMKDINVNVNVNGLPEFGGGNTSITNNTFGDIRFDSSSSGPDGAAYRNLLESDAQMLKDEVARLS